MANVEINDLTLKANPSGTDEIELQETGGGASKKTTVADLAVAMSVNTATAAEFEALAAKQRDQYAGSGFVEWGRSRAGYSKVNYGLFTHPNNPASNGQFLLWGNGPNSVATDGVSRAHAPVANVNGYRLQIDSIATSDTANVKNYISFPPAPATSALLDRQDLVFLEVWHEDVSEKDFVYPYGNTQFGATTYTAPDGSTIAAANGAFSGYTTYSLFGNWQSASALIGKGMVWSTMTDANKQKFVGDPENNMYLDGTKVIQVRYRVRVIVGLGSAWGNTSTSSSDLQYDGSNKVLAKGKSTSIASDLGTTNPFIAYTAPNSIGSWQQTSSSISHNGRCFALPIALVHRRNQGAFHPVFNPNGTRNANTSGSSNGSAWYGATAFVLTSVADCFNVVNGLTDTTNAGAVSTSGGIGFTSGRPDGLYYDEINERDVLDLRNSARKVTDLKRTLEKEFNRLVAGTTRGWSTDVFTTWGASEGNESEAASSFYTKTILWCDLIGSYANLKTAFPSGVEGHWLSTDEEGNSLVPDGVIDAFKLSKKAKATPALVLRSTDSGSTWAVVGSPTFSTTTNAITLTNEPAANIVMVFYLTEASPFELASNAEVLSLGEVVFTQASDISEGGSITPWLIAKVGEEPRQDYGTQVIAGLSRKVINNDGLINTSASAPPTHAVITPLGTTYKPAVKALPYFTRANGKLLLQTVYKEMHHNGSSWGDDEKFNIVDNESTTTDDNAYTVKIGQKRIKSELLPYFIGDAD